MRSALSQLDVPPRSAYVMAVVTPAERPAITGALFSAGALPEPRPFSRRFGR